MSNKYDEDFMRDEYTKDNICNARKNPKNKGDGDNYCKFIFKFVIF